ncbi:phospholipase A and acyltransferase 3-like isoform X2 [Aquarana catesbeiana]|uniref:phospholipase A and acyltransferase 3-like isoform X2 n=1 Tax=Aquarana catesbeiana TaxID=8400 RepID=UPI003CCA29B7
MPLIGLEPKPGDLIAFIGIEDPYDHWGVYVGDDYVVHIQARKSLDEICKIDKHIIFRDRAKVEFGKLEKVAGERYYLVNNTNDIFMTPYDAEEIVRRAKSLVGKKFGYSMIGKNCEHFVNYVRYEEEFSKQSLRGNLERSQEWECYQDGGHGRSQTCVDCGEETIG